MRTLAMAAVLGLCLLGAGCDRSPTRYAEAERRYVALVDSGRRPTDPGFDEVLSVLEKIPEGSKAHSKARTLREAISRSRGPRAPRPLAPVGALGDDPEIDQRRRECEGLAQKLGTLASAERAPVVASLGACREALARLEASHHAPH